MPSLIHLAACVIWDTNLQLSSHCFVVVHLFDLRFLSLYCLVFVSWFLFVLVAHLLCVVHIPFKFYLDVLIFPLKFVLFFQDLYPFSFQNFNVDSMIPFFLPFSLVGHSFDVCCCLALSLQVNKSMHICSVHLVQPCWILSALTLQRIVFLESL